MNQTYHLPLQLAASSDGGDEPHSGHEPRSGHSSRLPGPANTEPYRIVVASGNPEERSRWAELLSDKDTTVLALENGEAVLRAVESVPLDLVVAAVSMSKADGLEVLREIPQAPRGPAIILIAAGESEIDRLYLKIARLQGAAATFTQPLDPIAFLYSVRSTLSRARAK